LGSGFMRNNDELVAPHLWGQVQNTCKKW
jgi:hypothetical protein